MSNISILKIGKKEAAKRQLETAIGLWVKSGEPVSIHTLAAAAMQILYDLAKKQGMIATLHDLPMVFPAKRKTLQTLLKRYENFFKHADSDPNDLLDFNPDAAEMYLLEAVLTYQKLFQDAVPAFIAFKAWMFIKNPDLIEDRHRETAVEKFNSLGIDLTDKPKSEFFEEYQVAISAANFKPMSPTC